MAGRITRAGSRSLSVVSYFCVRVAGLFFVEFLSPWNRNPKLHSIRNGICHIAGAAGRISINELFLPTKVESLFESALGGVCGGVRRVAGRGWTSFRPDAACHDDPFRIGTESALAPDSIQLSLRAALTTFLGTNSTADNLSSALITLSLPFSHNSLTGIGNGIGPGLSSELVASVVARCSPLCRRPPP